MKIFTKETNGLKALVLSDLHIFNDKEIKSVEDKLITLKNNQYDVIYLVGDILDSTNILYSSEYITGRLIELIAYLGHIAPTYIVYGSHDLAYYDFNQKDHWSPDEEKFKNSFLNLIVRYHNIHVLENETVFLDKEKNYTLSGFNPSLAYALKTPDGNLRELMEEKEEYAFLKRLDPNKTNTLLCHYPNVIMSLEETGVLTSIDLSIAGHNHNGVTQIKFFPLEKILNALGETNRGIITPGKSLNFKETEKLRGVLSLSERNTLVINPAFKTFAASSGILEKIDGLFYRGYTEIEYVPEAKKLTRTK